MTLQLWMATPVTRWGFTASVDSSSLEGMSSRIPSSDAPAIMLGSRRDYHLADTDLRDPFRWPIQGASASALGPGRNRCKEQMRWDFPSSFRF
jgi:hypothetical protein